MIQFKLEGVDELLKNIEKKTASQQKAVKNQINKSAVIIETSAKGRAPVDRNRLRSSIRARFTDEGLTALVGTEVDYAPFVEFGTKGKVDIPAGLEQFASQFRGSKSGGFDKLLESIRRWAGAKNIPQEAVYPIALKIAREGVSARPFLFPSVEEEKPRLIKGIKEALK